MQSKHTISVSELERRARRRRTPRVGSGGVRAEVLRKKDQIRTLAAAHGARSVWLFGSAARGAERPESDLDFLVELEPGRNLLDLIGLENDLANALRRKVDVVSARSVKPRVLQGALEDAIRIV